MICIFTKEIFKEEIQNAIATEPRLDELAFIYNIAEGTQKASADHFIVDERGIVLAVDWFNLSPPYLLPQPIAYQDKTLLGLIFFRLGNYEKAFDYLMAEPVLLDAIDRQIRLAQNIEFETILVNGDDYRAHHNSAVLAHYANTLLPAAFDEVRHRYYTAMATAPNDELKAFTAKHYATLLADGGDTKSAELVILDAINYAITEDARVELKSLLNTIWLGRLVMPHDQLLLSQLKEQVWYCLTHYENQQRETQAGLVLLEAAQVASFTESFAESLGYINKAIDIFRKAEQLELLAQAQLRKGTLLCTWAQQGNPQFYKGAMEALQESAKIFTREAAPELFAEIHHQLGVIYSEIPDEAKKKAVWAAVSSSSFKEALDYFTREHFPYEYATICNHYANAYIKYPASRNSDNVAKALEWFEKSLEIRTADKYPMERCLTLLNYVEASWYADNGGDENNQGRYQDMREKLQQVLEITSDVKMKTEARAHLKRMDELWATFTR